MAEEEIKLEYEEPDKSIKEEIEKVEEAIEEGKQEKTVFDSSHWNPKTGLGKLVKEGRITDINEIMDKMVRILEPEIVDSLIRDLKTDLLMVGQSKGKFGGGKRRVFRQTQKKTQEGNKPKFATVAVVGNEDGFIGIGYGKAKETVPAREKSLRNAKIRIFKIRRGCGSWQCGCKEPHSIPFAVLGKCGSAEIKLMPAPKGTGLKVESECQKILRLAGIKDAWSKTRGQTGTKINLIYACEAALKQLIELKINPKKIESLGIVEGKIKPKE